MKMVKYQFSFAAQWVLTLSGEGSGLELIPLGRAPETCSNPAAPSTRWRRANLSDTAPVQTTTVTSAEELDDDRDDDMDDDRDDDMDDDDHDDRVNN
ncbi:hypothetical protein HMPREF2708_05630 [Corynebacterium sp. HMSC073H12]|nr:hypothetical protein HMPREF2708_05630 [Corynebacterium sp. HMSC073H12]